MTDSEGAPQIFEIQPCGTHEVVELEISHANLTGIDIQST